MKTHVDGGVCALLHDGECRSLIAVANRREDGDVPEMLILINNRRDGHFGLFPLGAEDVAALRDMFNLWLEKHAPVPRGEADQCVGCGLLATDESSVGRRPDGRVRCNDCQREAMGAR